MNTFGDSPAISRLRIDATLPLGSGPFGARPNRLSTRSTYARGASNANQSPSSFDVA